MYIRYFFYGIFTFRRYLFRRELPLLHFPLHHSHQLIDMIELTRLINRFSIVIGSIRSKYEAIAVFYGQKILDKRLKSEIKER